MTMVPSPQAFLQLKAPNYAPHNFLLFQSDTNCVAYSDLTADHMEAAEQDSLSTTSRTTEPGSCSRPFRSEEENWLQLGLGQAKPSGLAAPEPTPRNLVELDLLSGKPAAPGFTSLSHASDFPLHPPAFYLHQHGVDGIAGFGLRPPECLWNFRQMPYSSSVAWNLPCSPLPPARPSPSSSLMKIVDAPPRPNSGIWFVLQAEQKQIKELILPQVQKSYLRIKDGKMTVLLIMKYLANKLRLKSESEVEITCKGQRILPSLTLQHVRDTIWCAKEQWMEPVTSFPGSPTTDHIMVLNYGRSP
ncbi:unnamed protein product [Victoria cruziana]